MSCTSSLNKWAYGSFDANEKYVASALSRLKIRVGDLWKSYTEAFSKEGHPKIKL